MGTPIPLDTDAIEALAQYRDAAWSAKMQEEIREKAKAVLIDFLLRHDADVGTIDGAPAVRLIQAERPYVDQTRMRDEEPFLYRRFLKTSHQIYVRPL